MSKNGLTTMVFLLFLLSPASVVAQPGCVHDALGREVCLDKPAGRIVSLSPGATELIFSAGAGDALVGASAWSDYPPEARELPRVGNSDRVDLEAILALEPDLVVGWTDGNSRAQLDRLPELGVPVFWLAPRTFEDIAAAVKTLGLLTGHPELAERQARDFLAGIEALQSRHGASEPVRVFYQVWDQPLMTVNGEELISKAIQVCGGTNVFTDLPRLVPRLSVETLLAANPEVIVTAGRGEADQSWLERWRDYPTLAAVASDNLFLVSPDLLQRATFRMLDGTRELCDLLEQARARL
ncbi:cobalamin-binding protein [Marinobacter zhanjiangensis]|uniref:Cobalamin-binding protein n=1 Tax=Marinobacter zhanjiangensis TaxID=578215 RepID=A0ABQ3AM62_9GAMM|nr:cobalamin-binding protein [Marinobacter zhanjiangensis]GGY58926.1 cobalamin-binding protein [Marinobacter zhanjiangensis]